MVRFKVCCIQNVEEMFLAVRAGASAIGLVSAMPSGPGPIAENKIAEIAAAVPPGVSSFLLTAKQRVDEIVAQGRRCCTDTIQLVDSLIAGDYDDIRKALPGIRIVQVIHVNSRKAVETAVRIAPEVDAILLDSGNPDASVKELGGTGRVHDWHLSREIVKSFPTPVYLAGGLNPENVGGAVRSVQPFAVDVCSGLRTDGALDTNKLENFAAALSLL